MTSVSIVIPTRNRPTMLRRCVESAIRSLPANGEVIVVDDHSSVPASEILKDHLDERIRVLQSPKRGGSAARNFGFSQANGDVLFFLDDDDEILSHYCRSVVEVVQNSRAKPDFGFCAQEIYQGENGEHQATVREKQGLADGIVSSTVPFKLRTFPFSIGLWMTRETFSEIGPIDEGMKTNSDTEYSCRLFAANKIQWYSSQPGVRIHLHSGGASDYAQVTHRTPSAVRAASFRAIIERHITYLQRDKSAKTFLLSRYAQLCAKASIPLDRPNVSFSTAEKFTSVAEYSLYRMIYALRKSS